VTASIVEQLVLHAFKIGRVGGLERLLIQDMPSNWVRR
jgi:hypothetical protein